MAGIYVHIPFCKSRCVYCGFYSTTFLGMQNRYIGALVRELEMRRDYLGDERVETVYIGGGTPSQLSVENLRRLLSALPQSGETTIECNPDDVTPLLAQELRAAGVNRVSMGVQSFSDERLLFLRRRHTAKQARKAVETLREAGFLNISIDLMFGFPGETLDDWLTDIGQALELDVAHISAYSLMYEEDTPLFSLLERGEIEEIDEELSREMYFSLIDKLTAAGYEHYEISNFAKPGYYSRHNSSYWHATPYLGIGAGAHSYDRQSRQWNISNLALYLNNVESGELPPYEREELDAVTRYNDAVTTALRTREGIALDQGEFSEYMLKNAQPLIANGLLLCEKEHLHLTRKSLYISDEVMSELIFV